MASLNRVELIGNLGADPEIKSMRDGKKVANMRLACSESWKDRDGNRQERTEWVSVVCFNEGLVKVIEAYTRKGSQVYVSGKLQTRKWQDQSGADRYSTEVVMQAFNGELILLGGKPADGGQRQQSNEKPRQQARQQFDSDLDDEIPGFD